MSIFGATCVCMNATINFHHFISMDNSCSDFSRTFRACVMSASPMDTFVFLPIFVKTIAIEDQNSGISNDIKFSNIIESYKIRDFFKLEFLLEFLLEFSLGEICFF